MEDYIIISNLNDFVFCPRSIYFHRLYGNFAKPTYQQKPQIVGTIKHKSIDMGTYSSEKKYLQAIPIWSEKYKLCGKIDLYDQSKKLLIERKTKITKIYDGYRYQVWAQYFCLREMGYEVEKITIRSLEDNQLYTVPIPKKEETKEFEKLLHDFRSFDLKDPHFFPNPQKCQNCIYAPLCDRASF